MKISTRDPYKYIANFDYGMNDLLANNKFNEGAWCKTRSLNLANFTGYTLKLIFWGAAEVLRQQDQIYAQSDRVIRWSGLNLQNNFDETLLFFIS